MTGTFIDTSFLIASLLEQDVWHSRALAWQRALKGPFLTTEFVLLELVDALSRPRSRLIVVDAVTELRNRSAVRIIPLSTTLMNEGLDHFLQHKDKAWSLTDCTSFVIMRREGLNDALTTDRDFEQAGFRALLRLEPNDF